MAMPPAHRIARHNYPIRSAAFAYTLVVMVATWIEAGRVGVPEVLLAIGCFLVYPQLAYLYARVAVHSKRAELNNLYADCLLLGMWVAHLQFALWPGVMLLGALCLNAAGHGHLERLLRSLALFAAGAALWSASFESGFKPESGPLVSSASAFGILAYASAVGSLVFLQNKHLLHAWDTVHNSETQFRFVADRVGEMVAVLDASGHFLYASASHARHFSSASARSGANWLLLVHPDDLNRARSFLENIGNQGPNARLSLRLRLANGTVQNTECHANPVHLEEGKPGLIVLVCRFVRQPQQLRESA